MPSGHSYVAGHLLLEIGGASAGFIRKVEGGGISAEISSGAGPSFFANKHLGSVVYEDVTVEAGVDMGSPFWDWIKVTLEGKYELKDVSIVACDYDLHAQSTRQFRSAVITEITFPDLDASSKDPVYVRVKFAPEVTHSEKGDGKARAAPAASKAPRMTRANFKLEIPGLDCARVTKIESLSMKGQISTEDVGEQRVMVRAPARLELDNPSVTFSAAYADTWQKWFDEFVLQGRQEEEKTGTITFLAPNMKDAVASLKLVNLGIFRLADEPQDTSKEGIHRVTAGLYCERMELHPPKAK